MKYLNKRNEEVVTIVKEEVAKNGSKFVTVVSEAGEEKTVTESTFKRWYKKVEEEETEKQEETVEESQQETKTKEDVLEETTKETNTEEVEQPEEKKEEKPAKKKREPKDRTEVKEPTQKTLDILAIVKDYDKEIKIYPTMPNVINVKIDGHGVCEVRVGKKKVTIFFKADRAEDLSKEFSVRNGVRKYYLAADLCIDYVNDKKDMEQIKKALDMLLK